jgi:hypothetical protein
MIKLIDNWKSAWKFASVQLSILGITLMTLLELANQTWISLPPALQEQVPNAQLVSLVLFIAITLGRIFKLKETIGNGGEQS